MINLIKIPFKYIAIEINDKCQLHCDYCWTDFNQNTGKEISFTQLEEIFYLAKYSKEYWIKNNLVEFDYSLSIKFCAKEPLLSFNLIQKVIESLNFNLLKNYMFISFLTNGIGLTQEILLFCNKNQIHLSISLDGNKKIYDNHRKFFNGKGGFDSVIKGINLIKPSFITHSLCCTISPDTISLIPEIFDFFIPFTKMFTIAIGTDNNNFTIKNWDEYLIQIIKQINKLPLKILNRFNFPYYLFQRESISGMNNNITLYLENNGRLHFGYPLTSAIIRPAQKISSFFEDEITEEKTFIFSKTFGTNLEKIEYNGNQCQDCKVYKYCHPDLKDTINFELLDSECNMLRTNLIIQNKLKEKNES